MQREEWSPARFTVVGLETVYGGQPKALFQKDLFFVGVGLKPGPTGAVLDTKSTKEGLDGVHRG